MAHIVIVGDGPGGLSAGLFLAKNGQDVTIYGTDETAMHYAYLRNYLGVADQTGSEFQKRARAQVTSFGATIVADRVIAVSVTDEGFEIETDSGSRAAADYLILTEGKSPELTGALGLDELADGIVVDREYRSSIPNVYVVGRSARPKRSQAIISAGAGATAALDILSAITGKDAQDWDTPPKE